MKILNILLKNFRNYVEEYIEFDENLNIISGDNAQGKTNIVEAVYILSTIKTFKNSKLEDCIREGQNEASIEANFESKHFGKYSVRLVLKRGEDNEFFLNGNRIKKRSEMMGNVFSVIFSPDELKLVKGSPDVRRDFLDTDISQVSRAYSTLLDRYEYILFSRNRILKNKFCSADIDLELSVWDEQLALVGSQISLAREKFVKKLNYHSFLIMNDISGKKESLRIEYVGAMGETRSEKTEFFMAKLRENRARDLELGYTSFGCHRDDLRFFINDVEVKPFASQGQQRSVVLAIKNAEIRVFEEEKETPILLLDDVFSELDNARQKTLFEYIKGKQVLITCTSLKNKPCYQFLNIRVKNGKTKNKLKNVISS